MVSHRDSWAKLGRGTAHRMAMLRNMLTSLLQHERIITTHAKAKACQRFAERIITLSKENTIHHYRMANAVIRDPAITHKMFTVYGPRYANRPGGYTRVMHLKERRGDNAAMSLLELVDRDGEIRPAALCDEEFYADREAWMQEYHQLQTTEAAQVSTRDIILNKQNTDNTNDQSNNSSPPSTSTAAPSSTSSTPRATST